MGRTHPRLRGVDLIERVSLPSGGGQGGGTTVVGFPVYDAHGNDVATLRRNGSGGFALADRRTFDAWGQVRSEQHGNDPRLRYCGSLGHKQDDESRRCRILSKDRDVIHSKERLWEAEYPFAGR